MSDAIYNEVIRLVAETDQFKNQMLESYDMFAKLAEDMSRKIVIGADASKSISDIDQLIQRNKEYRAQVEATNKLLADRQQLAENKRLGYDQGAIDAANTKNVGLAKQAQIEREAQARSAIAAQAEAQRVKDAAALRSRLAQEEANIKNVGLAKQAQIEREAQARAALDARAAAERAKEYSALTTRLRLEETISKIKTSAAYKVGATVAGGKVGAAFDIAAGGAFALGATNLGGTIYMAERAAYALGIGQKTLGEFAEKLGLVKRTGEGAEASIAKFGSNVIKVGAALAAMAIPAGLMVAANELDKELADMSTLLADVTVKGEAFQSMIDKTRNSAMLLSNAFNVDVIDVVKGFKVALSTGVEADQLQQFGAEALTMSKALRTSFEDSVSVLTTFKDAYGTGVEDMQRYNDVLFNAINVGKFQVNDLAKNIGRVLTSASEAGVGVEDMMAALSTLSRVGMTTSQSITSLNSLIVGIVNPTKAAKQVFDQFGLATGSAAFHTRTLLDYLKQVRAATAGNEDVIGELFGNERARRGAIGLTANTALSASNLEEMFKVGTATEAAARAMDTFSENAGKVWNAVKNIALTIGDDLLNAANRLFFPDAALGTSTMDGLTRVLGVVAKAIKDIGVALLGVVNIAVQAVGAVLSVFNGLVELLRGNVVTAIKDVWSAIKRTVFSIDGLFRELSASIFSAPVAIDRLNDSMNESRDRVNKVATAVTGLTDVFGEFGDVTEKSVNKQMNMYDKLLQKLDAVKLKLLDTQFTNEYKDTTEYTRDDARKPAAIAPYEAKISKWKEMQQVLIDARAMPYGSAGRGQAILSAAQKIEQLEAMGVIIAPTPENLAVLQDMYRLWNVESERVATEAAAKRRASARAAFLTSNGVPTEDPNRVKAGKETSVELGKQLEGQTRKVLELMSAYEDLDKMNTKTSVEDVQNRRTQLKAIWDLIAAEELLANQKYHSGEVDSETYNKLMTELAARKAEITAWWDDTTKMQTESNDRLIKSTAERYKKEYEAAEAAYNKKMTFYRKEEERINKLIDKNKEFISTIKQSILDRQLEIRGPDYARRQYKEQIEAGTRGLQRITDPEQQLKAAKDLYDVIKKYVSASEASGNGIRGNREATEMEAALARVMEAAVEKLHAQRKDVKGQEEVAGKRRDIAEANNPVATAMRSEAQRVVKETLSEASKYGLTIDGDYKVDISKVEVKVQGLEQATVQKMVEEGVMQGIRKHMWTKQNQGVDATNGLEPAGARGIE